MLQSNVLSGRIPKCATKLLREEVFSTMPIDAVGQVARTDPLIVTFGNELIIKNIGNVIMRKYYTSSTMRLAAKLKMTLNKLEVTAEGGGHT